MIASLVCLLFLLASSPIPGASIQEEEMDAISAMIDKAKNGPPAIRPQAAARLIRMGRHVTDRLIELAGDSNRDLAEMGNDLIGILGRFDSEVLRSKLWGAIADPDFPWRPAAARSLATTAKPDELERFLDLLKDRIAIVRGAGLEALVVLERKELLETVRASLLDSDDRVRRIAATTLYDWGEGQAMAYLLEELKRRDTFFDRRTGAIARMDAFRRIEERLGDNLGYNVRKRHTTRENQEAFLAMMKRAREASGEKWIEELPERLQAETESRSGDLIGIELRSCRYGEFYLRWNEDSHLYVGAGHPLRVPLPPQSVENLVEKLTPVVRPDGNRRFWGEPGCDIETVYFRRESVDRAKGYSVSKGPDPDPNLRPDMLEFAVAELLKSIDAIPDDALATNFRQELRLALESVGGPIDKY